jgi:hypothetical protein
VKPQDAGSDFDDDFVASAARDVSDGVAAAFNSPFGDNVEQFDV